MYLYGLHLVLLAFNYLFHFICTVCDVQDIVRSYVLAVCQPLGISSEKIVLRLM